MWAKGKTLILSTMLQVAPFACADNAGLVASAPPTPPNAPNHPVSRLDFLSNSYFSANQKSAKDERTFRNEFENVQSKNSAPNSSPPAGLHWALSDQRPALEYRFNIQGTLRFHIGRHGVKAGAVWNF